MIEEIHIRNLKSITRLTMPLGRLNVLIGANGSGKSNILEAIGMIAAKSGDKIELDSLAQRGVRIARPELMTNSFYGEKASKTITIGLMEKGTAVTFKLNQLSEDDIYTPWMVETKVGRSGNNVVDKLEFALSRYAIFSPDIDVLRGLYSASTLYPLGIHGEGLDVLMSQLQKEDIEVVEDIAIKYIPWMDEMVYDPHNLLKYRGYKLGRSKSNLYFTDKFMRKRNNFFSAENANEGALMLLFYLTLMVSKNTPKFFAIDNIDSGLNPRLCRYLMKELALLAYKYDKQLMVTTHNPAVLDGLDLLDRQTKLFVVERSDDGDTLANEIETKPNNTRRMKLSEMWMNGLIGGVPEDFKGNTLTHTGECWIIKSSARN